MRRANNNKNAQPSNQAHPILSQEDAMINKLEEIFASPSYNCFYKSRVPAAQQQQENNNQRQKSNDQQDLQDIYLKDCPKAKLELCISFEKFRSLTIKYFKVFAPTRYNLYQYDIFIEIKDQSSQIIGELEQIQLNLKQLLDVQKNCTFMPLRKVYLQVSTLISPSDISEIKGLNVIQSIELYSLHRQQIQDMLFPIFQETTPLNFKQQFCLELQLEQQKSTEIDSANILTSTIVEFLQNFEQEAKEQFPCDKITVQSQLFFEASFYQRNQVLIKESLNSVKSYALQIQTYNKFCGNFQQYCPIRIYYDLYSSD